MRIYYFTTYISWVYINFYISPSDLITLKKYKPLIQNENTNVYI